MAKVFMSYRRTDSAMASGRIYSELAQRFNRKNVFKDVDTIPVGVRFPAYIQDALRQCAVELVIIGPGWLSASTETGRRRLDEPTDLVRLEIESGLALGLVVIPVLVEGASMPPASSLPESLRALAEINAVEVRNDPDFARDMERVVGAIERAFARPRRSRPAPHAPPPSQPAARVAGDDQPSIGQLPLRTGALPAPTALPPVRSAGRRRRGVFLAALAAVLVVVVASLGALLTQTLTAGLQFPYTATAPGPHCDPGKAQWTVDRPNEITCFSDHTHDAGGSMYWAANFPQPFTASVMMNPGPGSSTVFEVVTSAQTYEIIYYFDAYYTHTPVVLSVASGQAGTVGCSSLNTYTRPSVVDTSGFHSFSLHVNGASVTVSADNATVATCSDAPIPTNSRVMVELSAGDGGGDFSTFTVTPQ